jgi:hypothetical protein
MYDIDKIAVEWLEREDTVNREDRLVRLKWLASLTTSREYVTFHGLTTKYLYDEAIYCYVYGQFLASIILGLAFIEQSIAAILYGSGRNDLERAGIKSLLTEALNAGIISDADYHAISRIRVTRNPFTHFRPPIHSESIEGRALLRKEHPYVLIEEDAKFVMKIIKKLQGNLPLV